MNLIQGKSNQFLREAILEGSLEKTRRYLTLKIGKADVGAITESGGFSMLHCAALTGNTQIVMMLLQFGADVNALTDDGYTALDLAIWRGHGAVMDLLQSQGAIAPMKEPESLNGRVISHLGRRATVVDFEQNRGIGASSLRALYYEDTREARLVNLWAGTDYKLIGFNPNFEELRKLEYVCVGADQNGPRKSFEDILQGQACVILDSDSDDDGDVSEVVEVLVPPGPLGVLLDSGRQDCALVHGFTPLPNGEKGPIELHGGVHPGMYIIGINDTNASIMSLDQVKNFLMKLARQEKTIRFAEFRPDSPRRDRPATSSAAETTASTHQSAPESPAPTPDRTSEPSPPPAPTQASGGFMGGFSSRFASIASAMMDKKPATPQPAQQESQGSAPTGASAAPQESECVHCGMPSTIHKSNECPYR